MDIPKVIIKVETEQGEELATISVRIDVAGHWLSWQGQQLEAIAQMPARRLQALKGKGKNG